MNNIKTILVAVIGLVAITLSGCKTTSPVGITSSITPIQNKKIVKNLGKTSGSDSAYSVLSLWMIGKPDIDAAIKEALEKKGGDTLINVKTYEKFTIFGLWAVTTVVVEGEAIKVSGAKR